MNPDTLVCFDEPQLEFAHGQIALLPQDGLALYGPYSKARPEHPRSPAYMLIGTPEGVEAMHAWCASMNLPCATEKPEKQRLWPPYPSFEIAFGSPWSTSPAITQLLDRESLLEASRKGDAHERCFAVVELYREALERSRKRDVKPAVAICVVPEEVHTNCRPESRVANPSDRGLARSEKQQRRQGQLDLWESYDIGQYSYSPDFRRQLKARSMEFDIPVQIVRESTLRLSNENPLGQRTLTALSDRMWNMATALYYKAGGKPWKLHGAREGVCYIGLAFRRADKTSPQTACCAAQMFIDSGDGIVFLGEYGPWYSPQDKQFHLSPAAAQNLLEGALRTYAELDGRPLREIFLHSRSSIDAAEFKGFQAACPSNCKLVGIRVRKDRLGPRLFRDGTRPVLRGTFLKTDHHSGLLYATGFKPRLATYDGWETPIPLRIDVQHGEADVAQVAQDILGLTKLNYNRCQLGESRPVTVSFSDAVGEILISNPTVETRRPNFKYYI